MEDKQREGADLQNLVTETYHFVCAHYVYIYMYM